MKSLLATALALGVTVNGQYYIGNYTAGTTKALVPYPLGVCVPNGALSGYNYVIYTCMDGNVTEQTYGMSDTECESTYTSKTWKRSLNPGYYGYSDCPGENDESSYVQIGQYLSSCAGWKDGSDPVASTYISIDDACVYHGKVTVGGITYPSFSQTDCDGEGYTTMVYLGDPTCTTTAAETITIPLGCYFYESSGGLNIYSAWMECWDGVLEETERCDEPVFEYTGMVMFENLTEALDEFEYEELFQDIFWYATIDDVSESTTTAMNVTIELCSWWEFEKYESWLESMGTALLTSDDLNAGVKVCWSCIEYMSTNKTLYGGFTCDHATQCMTAGTSTTTAKATTSTTGMATTTTKSASHVYVSLVSLIGMLLFSIYF